MNNEKTPTKHQHIHSLAEEGNLNRNLVLSILLNTVIVVAEIIGGALSGSLALLSDALHNLSDAAALVIAWIARRFGKRPASLRHTYGLKRLEILLEGLVLFAFSQWSFWRTDAPKNPGRLSGEFLIFCALARWVGELFREPDAGLILGMSRGSFDNIFLVVTGSIMVIYSWKYSRLAEEISQ